LLLLSCTDHLVSGEIFGLYRCSKCGFIFTQDPPDENISGKYYESADYISHTDSSRTLFEKTYQFVRKIMLRRKRNLVIRSAGKKSGTILDIGSGTGHFLNSMKKAGWITTGIEINDEARKYASSSFGLNILPPSALSTLPENEFDCITLWHVAEHLHDISGYFQRFSRLLKPGGSVIVALPNSDSFDSHHYGKYWAAWDVPRHLWHFNPSTFSHFAKREGFTVTSLSVLPFDVFYISILSEKNMGTGTPALSGLVKGMLFYMRTIFSRMKASSVVFKLRPDTH
jgi:SAM-dependent methyltransferase